MCYTFKQLPWANINEASIKEFKEFNIMLDELMQMQKERKIINDMKNQG